MRQYLDLLRDVYENGVWKEDRTGVGTKSVFGRQIRFDLSEGFPLVTTKQVSFHNIAVELLWFLSGSTNTRFLKENGVTIWDEWESPEGELGPMYGKQWRHWEGARNTHIDQISRLIHDLTMNPDSRRHVITAWNPADLPSDRLTPQGNVEIGRMALAPCHCLFQFYVENGKLSCQMYQRSADLFLGVPYNIASYALLTHMVAKTCNLEVGEYIHTFGDVHLYKTHIESGVVEEQLSREPHELPILELSLWSSNAEDTDQLDGISLIGYTHHSALKAEIAV